MCKCVFVCVCVDVRLCVVSTCVCSVYVFDVCMSGHVQEHTSGPDVEV